MNVFRRRRADDIDADEILGWDGGFDVVLGNPPWERIKIQETGMVRPASARHCQRRERRCAAKTIRQLTETDPTLCDVLP